MTKEQAEKIRDELINNASLKSFCPLSRQTCRKDCIQLKHPFLFFDERVNKPVEERYKVNESFYCCYFSRYVTSSVTTCEGTPLE